MNTPLRLILALVTYLGVFVPVAAPAFFAVILLAGPHADLLPRALQPVVILLGWLAVLVVPAWAARVVWRRIREKEGTNHAG